MKLISEMKSILEIDRMPEIIAVVIIMAVVIAVFLFLLKGRRRYVNSYEDMEGHEFEYYCAELLEQELSVDLNGIEKYGIEAMYCAPIITNTAIELWTKETYEVKSGVLTASIRPHATKLYRI